MEVREHLFEHLGLFQISRAERLVSKRQPVSVGVKAFALGDGFDHVIYVSLVKFSTWGKKLLGSWCWNLILNFVKFNNR